MQTVAPSGSPRYTGEPSRQGDWRAAFGQPIASRPKSRATRRTAAVRRAGLRGPRRGPSRRRRCPWPRRSGDGPTTRYDVRPFRVARVLCRPARRADDDVRRAAVLGPLIPAPALTGSDTQRCLPDPAVVGLAGGVACAERVDGGAPRVVGRQVERIAEALGREVPRTEHAGVPAPRRHPIGTGVLALPTGRPQRFGKQPDLFGVGQDHAELPWTAETDAPEQPTPAVSYSAACPSRAGLPRARRHSTPRRSVSSAAAGSTPLESRSTRHRVMSPRPSTALGGGLGLDRRDELDRRAAARHTLPANLNRQFPARRNAMHAAIDRPTVAAVMPRGKILQSCTPNAGMH